MNIGARRRARSYALQVLYALDVNHDQDPNWAMGKYAGWFDLRVEGEALEFAEHLIQRVVGHLAELDRRIQAVSRNWRLERMSRVDRNVLRLAVGELCYDDEVPVKVAINEAVELAKRFGTSESPAFVNGILDRVAQELDRKDEL
jgi:transcription antitermination protein NusB